MPVQAERPETDPSLNISLSAALISEFPVLAFNHHSRGQEDGILTAYRKEAQQQWVVAFFAGILKSARYFTGTTMVEMAAAILSNASAFDISPSLAFALCWAESRFNPAAVNRANRDGSIDRGLFQLNNLSFPKLKEADFFNPSVNAYYGLAHLRWCLDAGGSVVAGLAMYNAGTGRVKTEGAPKRTLDYISYILEFQRKIEDAFAAHPLPLPLTEQLAPEPADLDLPKPDDAEPRLGKPRLSLLTPITGRF
ncbi:MAG: transglycosylase SLT domain-containing protein [Treponema sp.]|nr:transglycosylase SLT domain-containing protein [Treponema sp.]